MLHVVCEPLLFDNNGHLAPPTKRILQWHNSAGGSVVGTLMLCFL